MSIQLKLVEKLDCWSFFWRFAIQKLVKNVQRYSFVKLNPKRYLSIKNGYFQCFSGHLWKVAAYRKLLQAKIIYYSWFLACKWFSKKPIKQILIFLELKLARNTIFDSKKFCFRHYSSGWINALWSINYGGQINSLQSNQFLELPKTWPRGFQCRSSKIDNQLVPTWVKFELTRGAPEQAI